jgi:hypothetical protein
MDSGSPDARMLSTRLPIARTLGTLLATIASFATVYGLCRWADAQSNGPAIAAAVFSLGYGRRSAVHGARDLALVPLVVAFVALAALGVGRLLAAAPIAGAAVFVVGMFLAVYARNFTGRRKRSWPGSDSRRRGRLRKRPGRPRAG